MKRAKIFKSFLLVIVVFLSGNMIVNGLAEKNANILICDYSDVKIYRHINDFENVDNNAWTIDLLDDDGNWKTFKDLTDKPFDEVLKHKYVYETRREMPFTGGEENFRCPQYVHVAYGGWFAYQELCFSSNGRCDTNDENVFTREALQLQNSIYDTIDSYVEKLINDYTYDDFISDYDKGPNLGASTYGYGKLDLQKCEENLEDCLGQDIDKNIDLTGGTLGMVDSVIISNFGISTKQYIDKTYNLRESFYRPSFIDTYIDATISKPENGLNSKLDEYKIQLDEEKKKKENELKEKHENGEITDDEYQQQSDALENRYGKIGKYLDGEKDAVVKYAKLQNKQYNYNTDSSCEGLLGPQMSKVINNVFNTVKYAGPVLVFVFTIIDLIKAVASGKQDDMKKMSNKLIKRIIAAVALFFVPLICSFIFNVAGITLPPTCIDGMDVTETKDY